MPPAAAQTQRLSRSESQAQTRAQLVETAERLFLDEGFRATSLEAVAERAGYSKGAVYSNFANKNELCLAVLDAIHARQIDDLAAAMTGADTLDERLAGFERWAEKSVGDPQWTALELEFAASIRGNEGLVAELTERDRAIREAIAGIFTTASREMGIELPLPAEDLATAMLSLGIGLGLRRAYDPSVPVSVLPGVIRALATSAAG
jgi:AcrR family transcriptional regulator